MIRTARLTLRAPREDDLAALHAVFSDPAAMRYWDRPRHKDIAATGRALASMMEAFADTGLEYVVERDRDVIGKAGMWRQKGTEGEIGYILRPDAWGQGYATEAVGAVVEAAFARHPGLDAVTAEIDPRNTASAALLARLGFRRIDHVERAVEIAGDRSDSAFWRRDRPSSAAGSPPATGPGAAG